MDKQNFIARARSIHGETYDYNNVRFVNTNTKVTILCKKHGTFQQRPYSHLEGRGCPTCKHEKKKYQTQHKLIDKARKVHSNFYTYEKVNYTGPNDKVTITCPLHGDFIMRLWNHAQGQQCPLCGAGKRRTTEDFVYLAKEIHGDLYEYRDVTYKSATDPIIVTCKQHGPFSTTPDRHIGYYRQGCPVCSISKGERYIYHVLCELGISGFVCQKQFNDCFAPDTNLPLRYDFYIPTHNLLIEYDGQHHYQTVDYSGNMAQDQQYKRFVRIQYLDEIKNSYAGQHNIKLLRIPYWEYKEARSIIERALKS